jgi:nucleoid DNA-binding protein
MRNRPWLALGTLLAAVWLALSWAMPVHSQGEKKKEETFEQRVAKKAKVAEEDVLKTLQALAPIIKVELQNGRSVNLPGLGTFRVARVPQHRDMADGKVVNVAGRNYVEFLAAGDLDEAANADGVQPAVTVPPMEFNPLPGQTPSMKAGRTRVPATRTRD